MSADRSVRFRCRPSSRRGSSRVPRPRPSDLYPGASRAFRIDPGGRRSVPDCENRIVIRVGGGDGRAQDPSRSARLPGVRFGGRRRRPRCRARRWIADRRFSFLSRNGRAARCHTLPRSSIGSGALARTGRRICCEVDANGNPAGVTVSDHERAARIFGAPPSTGSGTMPGCMRLPTALGFPDGTIRNPRLPGALWSPEDHLGDSFEPRAVRPGRCLLAVPVRR